MPQLYFLSLLNELIIIVIIRQTENGGERAV